jgi:hypothetical protein
VSAQPEPLLTTTPDPASYWFYQYMTASEFDYDARFGRLPLGTASLETSEQRIGDIVFLWLLREGLKGWGIISPGSVYTGGLGSPGSLAGYTAFKVGLTLQESIQRERLAPYPGLSDALLMRQTQISRKVDHRGQIVDHQVIGIAFKLDSLDH